MPFFDARQRMAKKTSIGSTLCTPTVTLAELSQGSSEITLGLNLTSDAHKSARRTVCKKTRNDICKKTKYIPRPKFRELRLLTNQNHLKPLGATLRKEIKNIMGEIEIQVIFATKSRGALFDPRQSYIYTIFTPEPCGAQRGRRRGT